MHIYRNDDQDHLYLDLGTEADPRFVSFSYFLDSNQLITTGDIPGICDNIDTAGLTEITSITFINNLLQRTEYLIKFCQTDFMHILDKECRCDIIWKIITYKLKNYGRTPKKLSLKLKS